MKIKLPGLLAAFFILSFGIQSMAELRVWTDNTGKVIEAEHVRTLADKVVLKLADGSEIKVSLNTLTESDRQYALLLTPPQVEIKVSTKINRENEGYGGNRKKAFQIQEENIVATVSLRKTSSASYEHPLMSEIYLIGEPEQKDLYIILDVTTSQFQFTKENKSEHSYPTADVSLKQMEAGKQKGIEYHGYIAIVRDSTGQILATKCSRPELEKNIDAFLDAKKGDVVNSSFEAVKPKENKKIQNRLR